MSNVIIYIYNNKLINKFITYNIEDTYYKDIYIKLLYIIIYIIYI